MAAGEGSASGGGSIGPSTDRHNDPVIDPTKNVLDLVEQAIKRQDDLREIEGKHLRELRNVEVRHITETAALRSDYDEKLRQAEAKRIDAIRTVDVGAVASAASVQATQATTLAAQVANSAEALRNQVAATATQGAIALAAALDPIQKDIADLRRSQYEAQGQKTQVVEQQAAGASAGLWVGVGVAVAALLITAVVAFYAISREATTPTQPAVVTVTTPAP